MTGRQITEMARKAALHRARRDFFARGLPGLKRLLTRETAAQALLFSIVAMAAAFLAFPAPTAYRIGQVAENTIRADRGFKFFDRAATENKKLEAEAKALPVFVLDDMQPGLLAKKAAELFQRGRSLTSEAGEGPEPLRTEDMAALKRDFQALFRLDPDSRIWPDLLMSRFDERLERRAVDLALDIMLQGLMDETDFSAVGPEDQPAAVIFLSNRSEYAVPRLDALMDARKLHRLLNAQAMKLTVEYDEKEAWLITALARGLLRPNLKLDQMETQERLWRAATGVEDVYVDIRPGQVIVQEGTVVSAEDHEKLKALRAGGRTDLNWFGRFLGLSLALCVFYNVTLFLSSLGVKDRYSPPPLRDQLFTAATLLLLAAAASNVSVFGAALSWDFNYVDSHTLFYAVPFPVAAMLAGIFFGVRPAVLMAIMSAVTVAAVLPSPGSRLVHTLYVYNGAMVAALSVKRMRERRNLISASFWILVTNCLTLLALSLISEAGWGRPTANNFLAAAACGLFSALLAGGLIPLLEMTFGFSTNLLLLELGNLDRPILREMMLSAPGTYHHSVIMGAMVEAAAEAIGANPHLAKVGAYYHDIGKMKKPLYFVENQAGDNRHDTLAPSMSALILVGHVRDGSEIARAQRLPRSIIDIIEQHHGVSLMRFFYHKAKEQRQEGQPEVNEGDFRYPGPRPRSQEAGLVMLGDMCEAATRSLSEPTPAKINNLIRALVNQIFSDGQLDDCDLKTSEIPTIINIFTTILVGIYHRRVPYPTARKPAEDAEKKAAELPAGGPAPAPWPASGRLRAAGEQVYARLSVESPKSPAH